MNVYGASLRCSNFNLVLHFRELLIMGFGANSRDVQTFKIERLSSDMPMVVELVDTKENLERFLETIEGHIKAGLVTLEKAQIRFYRSSGK